MNSYAEILNVFAKEGRLRSIPEGGVQGCLDLTTNDYMGLAGRTDLLEDFMRTTNVLPSFSSSASRLLASEQREYRLLEELLEQEYGKPALLFNSGYHANAGCVSALSIPGTVIVADKLVHASIIDGITLGRGPYRRFRHNDVASLRREVEKSVSSAQRILVIVESIYSMDGDVSPLMDIVALKREFPQILLYVDEAHAVGVRGSRGLGVCEELGILSDIDILVGTFGKACASCGAYVVMSDLLKSFLINNARSFIFSTAIPPVNVAYTRFLFNKITDMSAERRHLMSISEYFAQGLSLLTGDTSVSRSQIVPLIVGNGPEAMDLSNKLRKKGVLALPIRRPTVPPGTERIRFSLNASLSKEDVDYILQTLESVL